MKCKEKVRFTDPKTARDRCEEINKMNKAKGDKTKLLVYLCRCEGWHLTSMPKGKYNNLVKKKEERFLRTESEYWENKLRL